MNDTRVLRHKVQRLEIMLGVLAVLVVVVAVRSELSRAPDVLTARTLRIVDDRGRPRFLLAAPLPDPQVQGQVYKRSRPVPGAMFVDTLGNETGGLGLFDDIEGGGLCFDYATVEAMCLAKIARFGYAGLTANDPPPPGSPVGRQGSQRFELALDSGSTHLTMRDRAGRPRIRIRVDSTGAPAIELLGESGVVMARMPQNR